MTDLAGLADKDILVSQPLWRTSEIKKGDFFTRQNIVCKDLGTVIEGIIPTTLDFLEATSHKHFFGNWVTQY